MGCRPASQTTDQALPVPAVVHMGEGDRRRIVLDLRRTFFNSVSSLPYFARDRRIAVSDYNIQNNLIFNYLILLPGGPQSWVEFRWFLDGWQHGGIFQASTGLPITPLVSGDPLG